MMQILRKSTFAKIAAFGGVLSVSLILFFTVMRSDDNILGAKTDNQGATQPLPMQSNDITRQEVKITGKEYSNIEERTLKITNSIGSFVLRDDANDDYFRLETVATSSFKPTISSNQKNRTLAIDISVPGEGRNPHMLMGAEQYGYRGTIGKNDIPTSIDFKIGAGNAQIALSQVWVKDLTVHVGAGSADISLEKNAVSTKASVLVGIGSLVYTIPKDAGLSVSYKVGEGNLSIFKQSLSGNGTYTSDNYKTAKQKLQINVVVGAGSIVIERK